MTRETCDEVWASTISLLCFDGHVLELFGHSDAQRFHVAYRPRIEVADGKAPRCTIRTDRGSSSFSCDPERVEEVRAFAARLAAAIG